MQSSWWARFRAPIGFDYFGGALKEASAIIAGALVAKLHYAPRGYFYYIQNGPVLPASAADARHVFEAVLIRIEQYRRAETDSVSHLRIEPRWKRCRIWCATFSCPRMGTNIEGRATPCASICACRKMRCPR